MSVSVGQLVPAVPGPRAPNITLYRPGPHIEGARCNTIDYNYDLVISIICAMYIAFGIVYTFFGYRCFKASMFLTGFTSGTAVVYLICLQEYLMPPYGNVGVSLCAGMLFGLITMLIQYVGLFMTGFHTGLLLAIAGLAVYDYFLFSTPTTYWVCVVTLLCTGIFFAVINLYWKKVLTILGTCVYGGAVIAVSLDYFLDRLHMLQWLWERAKLEAWEWPECGWWWASVVAWGAAAVLGGALQSGARGTGAGVHHAQSLAATKRRLQATRPLAPEQRDQLKQRKYRYLYQVRTAHGDVISQSFVQALQRKAQCGGNWSAECSTLQSDTTHLSALPPHTDSDDELTHVTHH